MIFWSAASLAVLTAIRLFFAARLPLAPDEAYYFLWSQHLQAGYFDHPPLVAFFIRAGTAIAGANPLGIRLFGPLSAVLGSLLIWRAGEDFFPGRHTGLIAAWLLNATLMVGVGAIVMTPDTPLFLAWTAGLAALGRLAATRDPRWWLAIGLAAGCGLLSKYTAFLFVGGLGAWMLLTREGRASLRKPYPWAGLALALLIWSPNLYWNATHGWVSLLKQGGRLTQFDAARAGQFFAELVAGQIALATPIIAGLVILGLRRLGKTPLLWLIIIPACVLVEHVLSDRVQANWPAILYPTACLAAAALPVARRWLAAALGLGFALTAMVYCQALAAPFPLPPRADPTALQFAGWQQLAAATQEQAARAHAGFITSDEYATASELAAEPGAVPILGYGARWHFLGLPPATAGVAGILISRRDDTFCPKLLGTVTRQRSAAVLVTYKICAFIAPGGSVFLNRPGP